jgi:predicted lipid-binding transport protein (Tim44 family)
MFINSALITLLKFKRFNIFRNINRKEFQKAVETRQGCAARHVGMEAHYGAAEVQPGAMKAQPGIVKAHPGAVMAGPGAVKVHRSSQWRCIPGDVKGAGRAHPTIEKWGLNLEL